MDFILELEDKSLVLIEVKASKSIGSKHLSGIKAFCEEKDVKIMKKIIVSFESTKRLLENDIIIYPFTEFLSDLWQQKIV